MDGVTLLYNKSVLLISPEPWEGIFVSKHHYAIELAKKNNRVFFLNPPSSEMPKNSFDVKKVDGLEVYTINYATHLKGARFYPFPLRSLIERNFLKKLERATKTKFDIIWSFENSRFFDFRFARKGILKIYHQVDLNQEFNPYLAAKTADIVFAVNDQIKERLYKYNQRVYKIPHGYSMPNSGSFVNIQMKKRDDQFKSAGISAMYVGNLDSFYLDFKIFKEIIRRNPFIEFYLIGPYKNDNELYKEFQTASNVHFIGRVAYNEIESYLKNADILLLLYRADEFSDYLASSHKVLEYLASGKVIVSSFMQEYLRHNDIIVMSEKNYQLPDLFDSVVQNLTHLNTPELIGKRKALASDNTYSKQLDRIIEKLKDNNLLS